MEIVRSFELALGDRIFAHAGTPLEEVVAHLLMENRATIAAAESCTGGLLAERADTHSRQFELFSRRGGLLQQRNEDGVGGRAGGKMIAAKGAVSSEAAGGAGGRNPASRGKHTWEWELRELPGRAAAARKNPWALCISQWQGRGGE